MPEQEHGHGGASPVAMIKITPNRLRAEAHNRMPVAQGPEAWPVGLGVEPADPRQLKAVLAPYPSERMTC